MVNQSYLISNINAVKDTFSINAKVVRLWRQYYYGGDTLASMDMILMDEEGSRISASINNKMVTHFDSILKEGGSVNLSNFYVVKNNGPYKVANHPFKINFHRKTKVKSIQSVFDSKYGFSFLPFTEFVENNVEEDQIVDVIGHVSVVGDVVHGERKGKKNRRMVVELTDTEGLKLKCTLWDSFIDFFYTKMEASSDHIKVFVFQFGTVRKYKESVNVSNTFYSSRLFINEDIPKIAEFRTRLIAQVGDDTSSLQVSNLTSESSQASKKKSFFYGTKYVNLEQLMDVFEPCACVNVATITSVEYEEGWLYTACCECNCKAVPNVDELSSKKDGKRKIRNTYRCETCGPNIVDVIPKFRVQVRVCDDSACASFLMFDRDVFSIVDRSAYALKEEEAANPDAPEYLDDLNKLIGKTLLFRVDVSRYNLINNYAVYTVGRMSKSDLHIKAFIKLYADEMDEDKDVNEAGDGTDGDNEALMVETTQNSKLDSTNSSKAVESSMAENVVNVESSAENVVVKIEPPEFKSTSPQGKRVIVDVDKDKGAQSVTSRNKKRVVLKNKDK